MNAQKKEEKAPGWLTPKNIMLFLSMLGIGGGAGYFSKESQEVNVNNVNVKEVMQEMYDNFELQQQMQQEKDRNQNKRQDQCFDELRQNYADFTEEIKLLRHDIKEIKSDIKLIKNEKNLVNNQ